MLKIFYGKQKIMQLFKGCLTSIKSILNQYPYSFVTPWRRFFLRSSSTDEKFADFSNESCKFIALFTTARPENGF